MSKHTPGPWRMERTTADSEDFQCRIMADNAFRDGASAIICGEPIKRNGRSNIHFEPDARLIAAAPEMLESLRCVIDVIGDDPSFDHCKRAIAKAEGK